MNEKMMPDYIEDSLCNAQCTYRELRERYDDLMAKFSAACKERDESKAMCRNLESQIARLRSTEDSNVQVMRYRGGIYEY